jgi:hypothetical protein
VYDAARKAWREFAPNAEALVWGDLSIIEPHYLVDVIFSRETGDRLNTLCIQYEGLIEAGRDCDDPDCILLSKEWYRQLRNALSPKPTIDNSINP